MGWCQKRSMLDAGDLSLFGDNVIGVIESKFFVGIIQVHKFKKTTSVYACYLHFNNFLSITETFPFILGVGVGDFNVHHRA